VTALANTLLAGTAGVYAATSSIVVTVVAASAATTLIAIGVLVRR
jgi:hypothetical protein